MKNYTGLIHTARRLALHVVTALALGGLSAACGGEAEESSNESVIEAPSDDALTSTAPADDALEPGTDPHKRTNCCKTTGCDWVSGLDCSGAHLACRAGGGKPYGCRD